MAESLSPPPETSAHRPHRKPANKSVSQPHARIIELCLLSLGLALSVFYFHTLDTSSLLGQSLQNSGHALAFLLGTSLVIKLLEWSPFARSRASGSLLALALAIGLITGITIEIAQPLIGRSASFLDIWYDLLGTCAAILLHTARTPGAGWLKRAALTSSATGLLLISAIQPLYFQYFETQRAAKLPLLFDFEDDWQREMFKANKGAHISIVDAPADWHGSKGQALRVDINGGQYPGVHFHHFEQDWRSYKQLSLDIFLKKEMAAPFVIRINDLSHNQEHHDRFNRSLSLHKGLNKLQFDLQEVRKAPESREMDLARINTIILFTRHAESVASIYIDNIRLD